MNEQIRIGDEMTIDPIYGGYYIHISNGVLRLSPADMRSGVDGYVISVHSFIQYEDALRTGENIAKQSGLELHISASPKATG